MRAAHLGFRHFTYFRPLALSRPAPRTTGLRRLARRAAQLVAIAVVTFAPAACRHGARGSLQTLPVPATTGGPVSSTTPLASRAALTAALTAAERRGAQKEAAAIRDRLREGDFHVGDVLAITITIDSTRTNQLPVRDSLLVDLSPLGRLPLRGVLRSEVRDVVQRFYDQFYRRPEIRVQPLIRVGFLGTVPKPGYYIVAPDAPVADAFSREAGGPAQNADLKRIEVKRGPEVLLDGSGYERTARDGLTFDQLTLRSGDEIHVPLRKRNNTFRTVRIVAISLGVITTILGLIRSYYAYTD